MRFIETVVDTLGTFVLLCVVLVLFGPYLILDRIFGSDSL